MVDFSELRLVESARCGDDTAFATLHGLYSKMVHGIILSRVPRSDVDDLVQDVFITAHQKLHSLRDDATFGAWLATISRRAAQTHYRGRREMSQLDEEMVEPNTPTHEAAEILSVIRSLPETYSEILILRLVEGMTGPEIAEQTGLTPASARVTLCRGMKLLREKLGMEAAS